MVVILTISGTAAVALNEGRRDKLRLFSASRWQRQRLWTQRVLIDRAEAKRHFDASSALFVDARSMGAYRRGHIRGALWCPVRCLSDEAYRDLVAMVPEGGGIVAYCDGVGCSTSDHLAWELHQRGSGSVAIFRGGWQEWVASKYPIETGPSPLWNPPCAPADPLAQYELSLQEAKDLLDSRAALFIDARTPSQFRKGHIPRARSLPVSQYTFEKVQAVLDYRPAPDTPLVVYCDSEGCGESRAIARKLLADKVKHLKIFTGGWTEWVKAGYPKAAGR